MSQNDTTVNTTPLKAKHTAEKQKFLQLGTVKHIDVTKLPGVVQTVDAMKEMAFSARDLGRAADIYDRMLRDRECGIILTLAGSLISAGLKKVIVDMVRNNMVDAIVSTGANIVDQDFFEALGFRHYQGSPFASDNTLRELHIDRIYDTFIDEDELRVCDDTIREIADSLAPGAYSSREFIRKMFGRSVDDPLSFDVIVNEAGRSPDELVDWLEAAARTKFARLRSAAEDVVGARGVVASPRVWGSAAR